MNKEKRLSRGNKSQKEKNRNNSVWHIERESDSINNKEKRYDKPFKKSYDTDNKRQKQYNSDKPYVNKPKSKTLVKKYSDTVRLNKFIANSGICSRREADEYIKTGLVTVNGKIVTELGTKININDDVRFNNERIKGEKKVYLLLNKPKNYITTMEDPHAKKTVMDLVKKACKERIYPVGRLDRNTTGVLLFTNDGDLTKQLTHPSYMKKKIYHVFLDKNVSQNDMISLVEGIKLEDGIAQADVVEYVDGKKNELGVEIHSGRNRIIRRMFEYLGYKVEKLDRVYFAGLTKKKLRRGEWRFLTAEEVKILKMGAYE